MNIFIGCSASNYIAEEYFTDAKELLTELMKDNNLVFGACNSGLMGLSYDITKSANNKVIGVCPALYTNDFNDLKCDEEIVTDSVSSRTEKVIEISDILLFLPGGIGTVYELFTSIESKRCHEHDRPIIIYNCNGFYDKILEFIDKLFSGNFARPKDRNAYYVANTSIDVLNFITNYKTDNKTKTLKKL